METEQPRTNSSSSLSPSSWESSRRKEKCEIFHHHRTRNHPKELIPNSANYEARLPDRPVKTSHTTCRQGHVQQSDRTETSIFCLQNDATVCRTVTTFVCPQIQIHENLHMNFALQNLPKICWDSSHHCTIRVSIRYIWTSAISSLFIVWAFYSLLLLSSMWHRFYKEVMFSMIRRGRLE